MALSIMFTADFHLGMSFASLPEVREELAEARFECLKRLVATANQRSCSLFIIAGDLFHRTTVPKRDVQRAAAILAEFQGEAAAVLPGNHDYLSASDELWKRFAEAGGSSLLLLSEEKPYPLSAFGIDACLYPGPCVSLHSTSMPSPGSPARRGIRHPASTLAWRMGAWKGFLRISSRSTTP